MTPIHHSLREAGTIRSRSLSSVTPSAVGSSAMSSTLAPVTSPRRKKKKPARWITPRDPPRRLTRQRAPRQRRVALYLVVRRYQLKFLWDLPVSLHSFPAFVIMPCSVSIASKISCPCYNDWQLTGASTIPAGAFSSGNRGSGSRTGDEMISRPP